MQDVIAHLENVSEMKKRNYPTILREKIPNIFWETLSSFSLLFIVHPIFSHPFQIFFFLSFIFPLFFPASSSSGKRFGFDRKRMLLPSRMFNEKPQRRTTSNTASASVQESRSQTAMSFTSVASEPCWYDMTFLATFLKKPGKLLAFTESAWKIS